MQIDDFILEAGKLKSTIRKGWKDAGIPTPESVADHSFRTALMSLVLCPKDLDKDKVVKMALVHELGEVDAGDITPYDGIAPGKKKELESACVYRLCSMLPAIKSEEIAGLWKEYEDQNSKEASFVKEVDVLEMVFQALEYERTKPTSIRFDRWTFWEYADQRIHDPKLKILLNNLKNTRD